MEDLKEIDVDLESYYIKIICIINLIVAIIALPLSSLILSSARSILSSNSVVSIRLTLVVLCLDILSCLTYIILSIALLLRNDFLDYSPLACNLSFFFYIGSIFLSIWFLAVISLERFLYIVLDISISLLTWLLVMTVLLIILVIIGFYSFFNSIIKVMPLKTYCFLSPVDNLGYINLIVISILNWASVIIVAFSYTSILIITIKTKLKTRLSLLVQLKKLNSQLNIAIIRLLLILCFYLLTNSYEAYLESWSILTRLDRSKIEDFISAAIQNFNPLVNCILVLLINKDANTILVD